MWNLDITSLLNQLELLSELVEIVEECIWGLMHLDDSEGVCEGIRGGGFLGEEVGFMESSFKL